MNTPNFARRRRLCSAALLLPLAAGCGSLGLKSAEQPTFYSLDAAGPATQPAARQADALPSNAPTLIVNPPHASGAFDSKRIIYVRQEHKLEYFAHNQWADTPARMLAPLIVAAVERSGAFRAVVQTPSAAAGDLRLDTEIIRLEHDFATQPSGVRFTLRAYVVDNTTRQVLAWREFDELVPAASENPYGGVVAANRAVQAALAKLAAFCAEAARLRARAGTSKPTTP